MCTGSLAFFSRIFSIFGFLGPVPGPRIISPGRHSFWILRVSVRHSLCICLEQPTKETNFVNSWLHRESRIDNNFSYPEAPTNVENRPELGLAEISQEHCRSWTSTAKTVDVRTQDLIEASAGYLAENPQDHLPLSILLKLSFFACLVHSPNMSAQRKKTSDI